MEGVKDVECVSQGVLNRMAELYKEAFRFIDQALKMEERGKVKEAVLCYEKGLKLVGTALSLNTNGIVGKELEQYESLRNKLEKISVDGDYRLTVLRPLVASQAEPSAPPMPPNQSRSSSNRQITESQWESGQVLISIDEGIKLFHVDAERSVSTWLMPCTLKVVQILGDDKDQNVPPAFMQCGEWIYPLHPGKSPALKSFDRTYMFPDINLQLQDGGLASVGIVLAESVPETMVARFERILSCYCDLRKYSPRDDGSGKPPRPPPPYQLNEKSSTTELALVPAHRPDVTEVSAEDDETERTWSQKLSNGILVGAKWASWGLSKGAEVTSHYVEKGAVKLREHIQPNLEPTQINPEIARNVQQIKEATGAAVKVSTFLVATLCTITIQLGKQLSPTIRSQGSKLIPDKYKNDSESGQKAMDNLVMVASAGVRGFGTVFASLEESGKALYASVTKATVDTVNYKYGEEAGDVTGEAMAAAGNTAQAYWNVKKLGAKAIAKRAAKDTSKAVIFDAEERVKSTANQPMELAMEPYNR